MNKKTGPADLFAAVERRQMGRRRPKRPTYVDPFTYDRSDNAVASDKRLVDQIVPIEAVDENDRQVLAVGFPGTLMSGVFATRLDRLREFPRVSSVVTTGVVRADCPLPNIRELGLFWGAAPPGRNTLANLCGLENLSLRVYPDAGVLDVEALPVDCVTKLLAPAECLPSLDALGHLRRLRELKLEGVVRGTSLKPLAALTDLRSIEVSSTRGRMKGLAALRSCTRLETVMLWEVEFRDLRKLDTWTSVRKLTLVSNRAAELNGIEAMTALEELDFSAWVDDLTPLKGLRRLHSLEVWLIDVLDLDPLGELLNLRKLSLVWIQERGRTAGARSLLPLARCENLEEVRFNDLRLDHGDFSPLYGLTKLRRVEIKNDDGSLANAAKALKRARPEIELEYDGDITTRGGIEVGHVVICPDEEEADRWFIFEDLVDEIGSRGRGNGAVEDRVKKAVAAIDRPLLARLEFDSEADNFCVYAQSEADIRAVAAIINELAASRGKKK